MSGQGPPDARACSRAVAVLPPPAKPQAGGGYRFRGVPGGAVRGREPPLRRRNRAAQELTVADFQHIDPFPAARGYTLPDFQHILRVRLGAGAARGCGRVHLGPMRPAPAGADASPVKTRVRWRVDSRKRTSVAKTRLRWRQIPSIGSEFPPAAPRAAIRSATELHLGFQPTVANTRSGERVSKLGGVRLPAGVCWRTGAPLRLRRGLGHRAATCRKAALKGLWTFMPIGPLPHSSSTCGFALRNLHKSPGTTLAGEFVREHLAPGARPRGTAIGAGFVRLHPGRAHIGPASPSGGGSRRGLRPPAATAASRRGGAAKPGFLRVRVLHPQEAGASAGRTGAGAAPAADLNMSWKVMDKNVGNFPTFLSMGPPAQNAPGKSAVQRLVGFPARDPFPARGRKSRKIGTFLSTTFRSVVCPQVGRGADPDAAARNLHQSPGAREGPDLRVAAGPARPRPACPAICGGFVRRPAGGRTMEGRADGHICPSALGCRFSRRPEAPPNLVGAPGHGRAHPDRDAPASLQALATGEVLRLRALRALRSG